MDFLSLFGNILIFLDKVIAKFLTSSRTSEESNWHLYQILLFPKKYSYIRTVLGSKLVGLRTQINISSKCHPIFGHATEGTF